MQPITITHASLFSGIGGAEVAAKAMGWRNLFHCEINHFARRVLDYWFPESESYEDITKTDFRKWNGQISVLTGGFPCQPFSLAGTRKGTEDDRYLWPQMLRAINEIRPDWVVAENVSGIVTMVEPGTLVAVEHTADLFETYHYLQEEGLFTYERICRDFEQEGYTIQPIIIPACAVGAPHRRDRIWFIAHRNDTRTESPYKRRLSKANRLDDSTKPNSGREDTERMGRKTWPKSPQERWSNFPTQSPIRRGNDGLPDLVDALTIPLNRWCKETIKAYGNAWVPQVAIEIFRAIEIEYKTV